MSVLRRRQFLGASTAALALAAMGGVALAAPSSARGGRKPNFIVILCDDLGFGDIEANGGTSIRTPNLNRLAREGTTLTDYYAPANICTPSRAGLLTGRYPIRTGLGYQVIMAKGDTRVLPTSEVTIATALKPAGYVSGLFGKWHLGHTGPDWSPIRHGFDAFFGIPYSHDMQPLELFADDGSGVKPLGIPVEQARLQQQFYDAADRFITANAARPFFVELALSAPHLPNYPDAKFGGNSKAGAYGDVVAEIDAQVGRLLARLDKLGIADDTLLIFTSDNGPWYEGSAGDLRDRKGGAGYDGGYRVPFIARQPGTVRVNKRVDSIAMGIDLLPTFCAMAGAPLPEGVTLDGADIGRLLTAGGPSPHDQLLIFDNEDLVGVRTQRWKYVAAEYYRSVLLPLEKMGSPQLYDVAGDARENYSVASLHPDVLADMQARLKAARATFGPMKAKSIPPVYRALYEAMMKPAQP